MAPSPAEAQVEAPAHLMMLMAAPSAPPYMWGSSKFDMNLV
jgi:hypothetical protein